MTNQIPENKKSYTLLYVLSAGLAVASTSLGITIGRGLERRNTHVNIEYKVDPILQCEPALAPLRREFRKNCEGRLYDDVNQKILERITTERDEIQDQFGCEEQEWICRPVDQYRVQDSKTEAVFKLR